MVGKTLAHYGHCLRCFTKAHNYNLITICSPLFACERSCVCLFLCVHVYFNEFGGFWVSLRDAEAAGALVCG